MSEPTEAGLDISECVCAICRSMPERRIATEYNACASMSLIAPNLFRFFQRTRRKTWQRTKMYFMYELSERTGKAVLHKIIEVIKLQRYGYTHAHLGTQKTINLQDLKTAKHRIVMNQKKIFLEPFWSFPFSCSAYITTRNTKIRTWPYPGGFPIISMKKKTRLHVVL